MEFAYLVPELGARKSNRWQTKHITVKNKNFERINMVSILEDFEINPHKHHNEWFGNIVLFSNLSAEL